MYTCVSRSRYSNMSGFFFFKKKLFEITFMQSKGEKTSLSAIFDFSCKRALYFSKGNFRIFFKVVIFVQVD